SGWDGRRLAAGRKTQYSAIPRGEVAARRIRARRKCAERRALLREGAPRSRPGTDSRLAPRERAAETRSRPTTAGLDAAATAVRSRMTHPSRYRAGLPCWLRSEGLARLPGRAAGWVRAQRGERIEQGPATPTTDLAG